MDCLITSNEVSDKAILEKRALTTTGNRLHLSSCSGPAHILTPQVNCSLMKQVTHVKALLVACLFFFQLRYVHYSEGTKLRPCDSMGGH